MKNLIYLFLIVFFSECSYSQTLNQPSIEVVGSAEMNVMPDIIELEIIITSNYKTIKNPFEDVEKKFFKVLEDHNIPKSSLSFMSMESPYYWYYWWYEYRRYYDTKTYRLRIDCTKNDFSFLKDFDENYIRSIRIVSSSHSKITDYRKQVKIEAIKMAKEKANFLLESIGQKAGKVIEVIEIQEPSQQIYPYYNPWYPRQNLSLNSISNSIMSQPSSGNSEGAETEKSLIPTIKLRYEIKAKFEII